MIGEPSAFMSYVRNDDDHDGGHITKFRERLEGEVRMQMGKRFPIFQDRNDISWGQQWKSVIHDALSSVRFLIPIVTPSFFESEACRFEFDTFLSREKLLGVPRLILPLYYVPCEQLEGDYPRGKDPIADVLKDRNWTDWREFRFRSFTDADVAATLARLAQTIRASIREIEPMIAAESAQQKRVAEVAKDTQQAPERQKVVEAVSSPFNDHYEIAEVTLNGKYDASHFQKIKKLDYYAFTRKFDEVVSAADLADEAELDRLYGYLTRISEERKDERRWLRGIDELNSIVAKLAAPLSLSVTILLDLSGSMRGRPISFVAVTAAEFIKALDRWGIRCELLGYTTRAWKGGQSREAWLAAGKPANPGRLNDLRHVIFKAFDESTSAALPNLGLLVREGLLKENIDGEALLWAYARLKAETTQRKHILVLSDGAPVDDSTISVNPGDFLERHLKSVLSWLAQQPVTISAIGIDHDISRYYPNSKVVKSSGRIGLPVLEELKQVLKQQ